jgi:Ca2+-binding RTX toxin-like protein
VTSAAQNITELKSGFQWTSNITYSFLTEYAPYALPGEIEPGGPFPLSAAQQAATRALFDYIESLIPIHFVNVVQDNSLNKIGDIAIGIRTLSGGASGVTDMTLGSPGSDGDIWLSRSYADGAASPDFINTMLHEIGHALGLKHPAFAGSGQDGIQDTTRYTVEAYSRGGLDNTPRPVTFQLYDIAALQSIYGAVSTHNPGDTTYSYGTTNVIESIWDTGGHDTLSAADSAVGAVLNLNPTAFSSIGPAQVGFKLSDPAKNISIAKGTEIEDAIGSNSDDILIGSGLSNLLDGRGGNDLIFGDEVVARAILPGTNGSGSFHGLYFDDSFLFVGAYQVQGTTSDADNDTIKAGSGDDWVYGGAGDDILTGGAGNDYLDGGSGTDIARYDDVTGPQTLLFQSGDLPEGVKSDGEGRLFSITRGDGTDILHSIEKVDLVGDNNTVAVKPIATRGPSVGDITINLGATIFSSNETLDFSQYGKNVYLGTTPSADGKGEAAGLFNNDGMSADTSVSFTGMTTLNLGANNDTIKLSQAADPYLHVINTGGGVNDISSDNIDVTINLQGTNDTVRHAGRGSVINVGTGHATIYVSDDILISGLKPTDTVIVNGRVIHGAIGSINSEAQWILGGDGVSYGLNAQGQLGIKDSLGHIMYISGYHGGPSLTFEQQTAGIFLGLGSIKVERFMDIKRPASENIPTTFKLAQELYYTQTGKTIFPRGNDPLVFDLTGGGINLTAVSAVAPLFDANRTGFAVHTGWFENNTGILVVDSNGNGQIDDISEVVGERYGGFAELAQADANGDGVIDANDPISAQLRIWRDGNGDGTVNPGELMTLSQAGIASINLAATAQTGVAVAGNDVLATGSFTHTDGTSGAVDAVSFSIDPFHSVYKGSASVSAAAAALPNLKGYGTLTDLRVAMTIDPALATAGQASAPPTLIDTINANLSNLNQIDLNALRAAATPILYAWAQAVQLPDANGNLQVVPLAAGHSDLAILVNTSSSGLQTVADFAYRLTYAQGISYFKLASGAPVRDAQGQVIDYPTFDDGWHKPAGPDSRPERSASWSAISARSCRSTQRRTIHTRSSRPCSRS